MIHFIATPVSLIGTFAFVKLLGFSINTLTLFGITLATGLVVDDAIVVIENIERHIAGGRARLAQSGGGGHGGDYKRRHRHLAGAGCGVCAGCVFSRNDRHSVSPVCADHRIFHRHFGLQRADSGAGAGGDFSARALTEKSGGGCESLTTASQAMTSGYRAPAASRSGIQAGDGGAVLSPAWGLRILYSRGCRRDLCPMKIRDISSS